MRWPDTLSGESTSSQSELRHASMRANTCGYRINSCRDLAGRNQVVSLLTLRVFFPRYSESLGGKEQEFMRKSM